MMNLLFRLLVFLQFVLIYLTSQSHELDMQSPFLEDTLFMHKKTAISLFRNRLVDLLNSLSARRHCRFVSDIANKLGLSISSTQNLINHIQKNFNVSSTKTFKRRKCRHWHSKFAYFKDLSKALTSKYNESVELKKKHIMTRELPKLYNNLPLPFQCEVLFEIGRLSAMNGLDISHNSINSVTKMNMYEVGNVIAKSEKVISNEVAMVKVANRCVKVLAGEKYRTTDIVVSVDIGNQLLQKWKRDFRDKMPWVCGKFALDNGIKIENLHNLTVKKNLPFSAYFTHILNATSYGNRHEIKFHMHLIQANSMALEARFVLSALNAVPKKTLKTIFGVHDIKYWAVDHYIGTSLQEGQSYSLKMLFPTYLRSLFNIVLRRHERCLIIHIISKYSNSSTEKVIKFLKRKRVDVKFPCSIVNGVMSVVLSPKRNRENELHPRKTVTPFNQTTRPTLVLHPYWHVHHNDPSPETIIENSVQQKIVHYKKATIVEIVMFILLGALGIVAIIFTITCTIFILRKRAVRKEEEKITMRQKCLNKDVDNRHQIVVDASRLNNEELKAEIGLLKWKSERLSRPIRWSQEGRSLDDKRQNAEDVLVGVRLDPLRFSTDDEESRCDDEEISNSCSSQSVKQSGVFYLGSKESVRIAQINEKQKIRNGSFKSKTARSENPAMHSENTANETDHGSREMTKKNVKIKKGRIPENEDKLRTNTENGRLKGMCDSSSLISDGHNLMVKKRTLNQDEAKSIPLPIDNNDHPSCQSHSTYFTTL